MPVRIEIVRKTDSTNADLLTRLASGEPVHEGFWLVANQQTAGRGRQGRIWLGARGNFMGSTAVRLLSGSPAPASLSFVASLAVYEAVLGHVAMPAALQLKWPNDLMLRGAKVAGILLERAGDAAVVGIGVNLVIAPDMAGRLARPLADLGPPPDRDAFAHNLAMAFDRELDRWRQFGIEPILARWLAAAHPLGAALSVHGADGSRVSGTFDGLESDGALRLRLADSSLRVIHAGDVKIEGN